MWDNLEGETNKKAGQNINIYIAREPPELKTWTEEATTLQF